jgi:hypothetical protein
MASSPQTIDGIGSAELTPTAQPISCDGFYSDDDEMRHVITGTADGDIVETFFNPTAGIGQANLINVAGLRSVGSFYTGDDCLRHVIALDQAGRVSEIYYSPKYGISAAQLKTIDGGNKVCGFYSSDDNRRHAIVGAASGDIFEIRFGHGIELAKLTTVADLMDVAGFYSADDGLRRVIAASLDGTITEIFYHSSEDVQTAVVGKVAGVRRIGAFYAPSDEPYSRRILAMYEDAGPRDGPRKVCELRYRPDHGAVRNELGAAGDGVDLAGFYSADDQLAHCAIACSSGESRELFY